MEENQANGVHENGEINGETVKKSAIPTAKHQEINFTPYMREAVEKVASSEGFQNFDVKINHGSAVGDGFMGLVFKVTIQEIDKDKKLNLVLKSPPDNLARRNEFGSMNLFRREVIIYNEVLPAFVAFQEERKIKKADGFFEFPKCYFAEYDEEKSESVIIMEDLRESGYKMCDKFVPHNLEHTKLLVSALGRLHAISFAMKIQKPEVFEQYKQLTDVMTEKFADENFAVIMTRAVDRAISSIDESDVKRRNRAATLKDNFSQVIKELVSPEGCEPFAVIGHGDCWSNNFMYQYKRGSPQKVCLLDWQISRYCSPALDLSYFFFICTDSDMRAKHYDELLNVYHRSLKTLLDHLGGDTMSQFPFTALLRQLKHFAKFGIIMATFLVPMITTKNEELPDMDFVAENMGKEDPALMEEMMKSFGGANGAFKSRMSGALFDAMRYGYL